MPVLDKNGMVAGRGVSGSAFNHDSNGDAIGGELSMNPDNKLLKLDGYKEYKIKGYLKPRPLHKKFLSGRDRPHFRIGSSMEREWYSEQAEYCLNGMTYKGRYINPLYYFFLNFTQFEVPIIKNGKFVDLHVSYPTYCNMDNYIFDIMWQAKMTGWHVSLMGGRGIGKSFIFTSPIIRELMLMVNSVSFISATSGDIVNEAWSKFKKVLRVFEKYNPGFSQKKLSNNQTLVKTGELIIDEYGEREEGYLSEVKKVIYGNNPDATRGQRPNIQLIEEFAAFPSKTSKGSLKNVFAQSQGSWVIGGVVRKAFVMLSGTGGSVENDEAKDLFLNPIAYRIYPINEWGGLSGIFIPVEKKYTTTWEKDGSPDEEEALRLDTIERENAKSDPVLYQNRLQEFPRNIREVFAKRGSNRFNQDRLAVQWTAIEEKTTPKVRRGILNWAFNEEGKANGVKFVDSVIGHVYIIEEPELAPNGKPYKDLYVSGVDSIDMGTNESAATDGSSLCCLVKKRIIDGSLFKGGTNNLYVAYYNYRSPEVRDDYEEVLKLNLYFGAKINLEWTRVNIAEYFRNQGYYKLFMKRPSIATADRSGSNKSKSKFMGTPGSAIMNAHMDEKVREYVNDHSQDIYFIELIEQLRDYTEEDRGKYDMVVAMGLAEIADADFLGVGAKERDTSISDEFIPLGYYTNSKGERIAGVIEESASDKMNKVMQENTVNSHVRFYDENNMPRFDEDYYDQMGGDSEGQEDEIEDFKMF